MAGDCVRSRERGFFAVGWLVKIVIGFALIGVLAADAISLALGHLHAQDSASDAATAAQAAYGPTNDFLAARTAAERSAAANDVTLADFQVTGGTMKVTITLQARTFLVRHLPGTASLVVPTAVLSVPAAAAS